MCITKECFEIFDLTKYVLNNILLIFCNRFFESEWLKKLHLDRRPGYEICKVVVQEV